MTIADLIKEKENRITELEREVNELWKRLSTIHLHKKCYKTLVLVSHSPFPGTDIALDGSYGLCLYCLGLNDGRSESKETIPDERSEMSSAPIIQLPELSVHSVLRAILSLEPPRKSDNESQTSHQKKVRIFQQTIQRVRRVVANSHSL